MAVIKQTGPLDNVKMSFVMRRKSSTKNIYIRDIDFKLGMNQGINLLPEESPRKTSTMRPSKNS